MNAIQAQPRLGAVLHGGGTTFRVWAPNASAVAVNGTFTSWGQPISLVQYRPGYWAVDVPGIRAGAEYKFAITNQLTNATFYKNDPHALTDMSFPWKLQNYSSPSWNKLVIYELHVGTFKFDTSSANKRGNFDTVISQLQYLQDLGINAIQLMPSDEFHDDIS
ncbi:hypothetical protein LTR27_008694 [Elasticomyces elasticus]|nr:hypothetical protein LTR27_008694 [Elasticomyces elasticus]